MARSYGDLRENHEFKAAKEEQKRLTGLKASIAAELDRSRGTDFATVRTDLVSLGTKVDLTELNSGQNEVYSVMGAWDSEPDNQIVSYLTPLAQALMNKPVGTEVTFDMGGHEKRYRINSIVPALATSTVVNPSPTEGTSAT